MEPPTTSTCSLILRTAILRARTEINTYNIAVIASPLTLKIVACVSAYSQVGTFGIQCYSMRGGTVTFDKGIQGTAGETTADHTIIFKDMAAEFTRMGFLG